MESLREYHHVQSRPNITKEMAVEVVRDTLEKIYGLCRHTEKPNVPPAAKDCVTCVAEEVVDSLERDVGLRWGF